MFSKRGIFLLWIFTGLLFVLSVRLIHIGILKGNQYKTAAISAQTRQLSIKSVRGQITDRRGIVLTDRDTGRIGIGSDGRLKNANDRAVYSVDIQKRQPPLASHLAGYTSESGEGLCGIEKQFDHILKNKGSVNLSYMATALGRPVGSFDVSESRPRDKSQVRLTIDYHIQKLAEETMDKYIKKGAAIIMDTRSFDVLAMVSRPGFDTDKLALYRSSTQGELLNRGLMSYNAGSVFKIITASAALEKNPGLTERVFDCQGEFSISDAPVFSCHKKDGHGRISFDEGFALSCNCCFYLTGLETDAKDIMQTAKSFGIGDSVLGGLPDETKGNLPMRDIYSPGEILNLAIGQGEILITPLQCTLMAAIIANGGVKRNVNIVSGIFDSDGFFKNYRISSAERVIKSSTAIAIGRMMRECVLEGTAVSAASSSVQIAGKTGSAETGWIQDGASLVHGWFCGFFPYNNPQYAMAIVSEGGGSGSESCVPPFQEIAEKINEIYPFKQ